MELQEALAQIAEIRDQLARTETFDGYRSATVAASGLVAIAAAGLQAAFIQEPVAQLDLYLALWVGVAVVGAVPAGVEMLIR